MSLFFFWCFRLLKDQYFIFTNKKIKNNFFTRFYYYFFKAFILICSLFKISYINYCIKKYGNFNVNHYSINGRGYLNYSKFDISTKKEIYKSNISRLSNFVKSSNQIEYNDKDSFFDVGCGKGENIKFLLEEYPNSKIFGVDISPDALDLIRLNNQTNKNLILEKLNLLDKKSLNKIKDNSYDHIILSHVFSVIFKINKNFTNKLRIEIINNLKRIASKSIIIIDHPLMFETKEKFVIEQINRGFYYENLFDYFLKDEQKNIYFQRKDYSGYLLYKKN